MGVVSGGGSLRAKFGGLNVFSIIFQYADVEKGSKIFKIHSKASTRCFVTGLTWMRTPVNHYGFDLCMQIDDLVRIFGVQHSK